MKPVVVCVALVLVFGWLLPRFVDYQAVWAALKELDPWEVVDSVRPRARACSERGADVQGVPAGPRLAARERGVPFVEPGGAGASASGRERRSVRLLPGGGYPADAAGLAALGSFLFPTLGRLVLPLAALVALLVVGEIDGVMLLVSALSLLVLAVVGAGAYCLLRTERSARWLGAKLQRPLSWMLRALKRSPMEDAPSKAVEIRAKTLAIVRAGWTLGSIGVAANLLLTYLILLAALRFVGVSSSELSAVDAFAAFAIAFWAGAVFPITGSGLGVVDGVLIASLIEISSAPDDTLVAAALLWRVFYSFVTLPLGAITLSRFRKTNPEVLHSSAARPP